MEFQQKYSRGKPITALTCHVLPIESKDRQGTHVRFWPDKEGLDSLLPACKLWLSVCISVFIFLFFVVIM